MIDLELFAFFILPVFVGAFGLVAPSLAGRFIP
jgi:hypothetical protein